MGMYFTYFLISRVVSVMLNLQKRRIDPGKLLENGILIGEII